MKTVLITGGTRGIGKACAEKFAKEGWNVALFYKSSEDSANALAQEVKAFCVKCDVSSPDEVRLSVEKVISRFGSIDVLVNNAGMSYSGLFQDMTDTQWNEIINTNLSSVFYLCREVVPTMLGKGGSIVNVSSMWGVTGASCEVAYSASKAGIIGFTKALAKELAPSSIRVNAVAPGAIMTDMLSEYSHDDLEAISEETPLGRLGAPSEIAEAVYFLASDKSGFITGEVLNVNGGFVI